ncbi:unnamed protein product [Didymodactylos carnosus]|uniref:Uncharacterized protein n=1 Tax=Didymodactylos carnosus TaxID=1234261 RepID=A0A814UL79_9BILA|nr:unnamed protein product [Didymodactylos carnosus]CAF3942870.1 unnamed protein product [Didymodactylos carnosus]
MSVFQRRFGRKSSSSKKRLKTTDTLNVENVIINQYSDQSSSYDSISSSTSGTSFDCPPPIIDIRCLNLNSSKDRLSISSTSSSLLSRTFSQQQQFHNDCFSNYSATINNNKHSKKSKLKKPVNEKENQSPFQTDKLITNIPSAEDLYEEALSNYKLELNLSKVNGNKEQECQITAFIGNTLALLGQYDNAIEWFHTYLNLAKEIFCKVRRI